MIQIRWFKKVVHQQNATLQQRTITNPDRPTWVDAEWTEWSDVATYVEWSEEE